MAHGVRLYLLRAWGGIGMVQSRMLVCPSWRRGSGHWSPGEGTGA